MITTLNIDNFNASLHSGAIADIKSTVLTLKDNYPKISQWFDQKVEPGLIIGSRTIVLAKVSEDIVGFTILKNDLQEKKICTFFVDPEFRGYGIAYNLFQQSFDFLGTSKPIMTIPENRINSFSKYMDFFNFEFVKKDYIYQANTKEIVFNGSL